MKLLLVEDARRLRQAVYEGLKRSGYAVDTTGNGEEAIWYLGSNDYDAVILDIMLPGCDGLTVLKTYRRRSGKAPVLLLTARDAVEDRVLGLQSGADDYLVKPFAFDELVARIQALTRRKYDVRRTSIEVADLEIDLARREVRRKGQHVDLAPREYALLELLALRAGEAVSRSEIEQHIYDERAEPMSNVVDSAICSLRRKIDSPGRTSIILTRRGVGYMIEKGEACTPSEEN